MKGGDRGVTLESPVKLGIYDYIQNVARVLVEKCGIISSLRSQTHSMSPGREINGNDQGDAKHAMRLSQLRSSICGARTWQELFSLVTLLRSAFLRVLCKRMSCP